MLEWVLCRVLQSKELDAVLLATTTKPRDDDLEKLAIGLGIRVFRGDETDVLGRFALAASQAGADAVVRVCADNPFVAPEEIDRLVRSFASGNADYAFNHLDRMGSRYADGFGAEIIRADVLKDMASKAVAPAHREHVTTYLWDNAADYRIVAVPAPSGLAHPELCFDVDTPEALIEMEQWVSEGVTIQTPAEQIVRIRMQHGDAPCHE